MPFLQTKYSYGAFIMAVMMIAMFLLGYHINIPIYVYGLLSIPSIVMIQRSSRGRLFWITLLCAIILAGIALQSYRIEKSTQKARFGQKYPIYEVAVIALNDSVQQEYAHTTLMQLTASKSESAEMSASGRIYVKIPMHRADFFKGQRLRLVFKPFDPESFYVPLIVQNLHAGDYKNIFWKIRADVVRVLRTFFTSKYPQATGLFSALLLGDRSALSPFESHAIQHAGISHLLALSGMHLVFFLAILLPVFSQIFGKRASLYILIFMLLAYLFLTGAPVSLVRAYLAFLLTSLLWLFARHARPLDLLGLAAIITLMINPLYLFSLSWQLSFAAVLGILTLDQMYSRLLAGWPKFLKGSLSIGLAATTTTTPILGYYFRVIYPQGILATLILTPLLSVWLLLGIVSLFMPFLGTAFLLINKILWAIIYWFSWMGSMPSSVAILIFSLAIPLLAYMTTRKKHG